MINLSRFKKATCAEETTHCSFNNIGQLTKYIGVKGAVYWFGFCYVGSSNVDIYDKDFNCIVKNADLLD